MSFSEHRSPSIPLLSPTILELDDEIYRQAQGLSHLSTQASLSGDESHQWQRYLNALGLLALSAWLNDHGLQATQTPSDSEEDFRILEIGEFRCCLIVIENCLSEQVTIPVDWLQTQAAHFYIVLEVAEEEDEVWFRGLIRQDQLMEKITSTPDTVTIPFTVCEPELSRLLHYCQYLDPEAIPLPAPVVETPVSQSLPIEPLRVRLNLWFDHVIAEGWQAWESLQPQLAYATRGLSDGMKQGKLVNLGIEVGAQPVVLVLTLTPEVEGKIGILIQLLPTGSDRTLPPNIELSLLSRTGKQIQSINSRSRDNYIQLKSFRGKVGQRFGVSIKLGEVTVSEQFEI